MARGRRSRQQLIDEGLAQLAQTDPKLAEVITSVGELARIQEDLGNFYTIGTGVETARIPGNKTTAPQREAAIKKVMEDINFQTEPVVVNGQEYIIEDFVRGTRKIDQNTPALVIQEKQRRYPSRDVLHKIPRADVITDDTLISMLIADARRDDINPNTGQMKPVMGMGLEDRAAPPALMKALESQRMLNSGPLAGLRGSGTSHSRNQISPRSYQQKVDIQNALIGDMYRNKNPRTGAPYGKPVVQNGKLVRDWLEGGHGVGFNTDPSKANDVDNLAFELEYENKGTSGEEKGYDTPMSQVFTNALAKAQKQGKNLGPLRQKVDELARAGVLDQRRVNELIDLVLMPPKN